MSYRLISAQGDLNMVMSSLITSVEYMLPCVHNSIMYVNVVALCVRVCARVFVCVPGAWERKNRGSRIVEERVDFTRREENNLCNNSPSFPSSASRFFKQRVYRYHLSILKLVDKSSLILALLRCL